MPGHGESRLQDGELIEVSDFINQFKNIIEEIIDERDTTYIGYSLGGLLGMKVLPQLEKDNLKVVGIGTGLRVDEASRTRIKDFFSVRSFRPPNIQRIMQDKHGNHWPQLIKSLQNSLIKPEILPNNEELEVIRKGKYYFILAENDQAYKRKDIDFVVEQERIFMVPGNHFTYYHQNIGWTATKNSLQEIINSNY